MMIWPDVGPAAWAKVAASDAMASAEEKALERFNPSTEALKLYTLYAPPNHRDGVHHRTRANADADTEHFDGKTSE